MNRLVPVLSLVLAMGLGLLAQAPAELKPAADAKALIERLGSPNFEERKSATEALRALGDSARPALEAARNDQDLERRFRVRALIEDLDAGHRGGPSLTPVRPAEPAPEQREEVQEESRDVPARGAWPRFRIQQRELRAPLDGDIHAMREEMQRLREEMRAEIRQMLEAQGVPLPPDLHIERSIEVPLPEGAEASKHWSIQVLRDGERMSFERKADGTVRLEVTPKAGGAAEVFEAKSMEEFRKLHPEAIERYGSTGLFEMSEGGRRFLMPRLEWDGAERPLVFGRIPQGALPPDAQGWIDGRGQFLIAPETIPSGPRLGISIEEVPALLRKHLKLEGKALVVTEVQPGSLAEALGMAADDLLLSIDGDPVGSAFEIRSRLGQKKLEPKIRVQVLRAGERMDLEAPYQVTPAGR